MSKCDLHIHSRYSARSEEWLFRRFDFPDSYSDPKELHRQLLKCGMDYVTITDHDTIEGCLQIADLPHTFISEQVTTYFPQDQCKLSILVWGISEQQHREIEGVRDNIFDLQHYLQTAQIAHAVAHPLYSVNGKLEASHLERLILLFKHFEGINGLRDALLSDLAQTLFSQLTPDKIEMLANRHNLAPTHTEPWRKILVGGSDDHGGQFAASAFTEARGANSAGKFLASIRDGNCSARGRGGTPLALSHGFYNTLVLFHRRPAPRKTRAQRRVAGKNVFAFHGGARSNGIHARRKSGPGRTSCLVGKDFRTVEACKRFALERALRLFRAT